jgi:thiol:disulfide interchange protein DsbD
MTIRTYQITRRVLPRIVLPILAVAMTLGIGVFANDRLRSDRESYLARQEAMASAGVLAEVPAGVWLPYTPELLATVRESGRPVFLEFTASWCITCKGFKAAVLDPMKDVFKSRGVVLLVVDCSYRSSKGSKLLSEFARPGVPQWAIYGPGAEAPVFAEFTPQSVLNALDAAGVPKAREQVRSASSHP